MTMVLLDTSVASFFLPTDPPRRERPLYDRYIADNELAISFQTVAELWKIAEKNRWGDARRSTLQTYLSGFLIIPYDTELGRAWARVAVAAERFGRRMEDGDAWIAATAVRHALPLITHDRDFVGRAIPGLRVVSRL